MRLLLAEDEKELASALKAVLIHNHYSVDVVYNGEEAYAWAAMANYDGLILDIICLLYTSPFTCRFRTPIPSISSPSGTIWS